MEWKNGIAHIIPRWELEVTETESDIAKDMEIRPELFDIRYEVSVRPASRLPYGELFEQEQVDAIFAQLVQHPVVNQQELLRLYLDKKFMEFESYELIQEAVDNVAPVR